MADGVAKSFQGHHEEIQRRRRIGQAAPDEQNPISFERAEGADELPFKLDSQTHFVWSASHEGMPPLAVDARKCAVRIYGLFGSHEEACEHAAIVAQCDPTCSLMVSPTHEWTMVPRNPERLADTAAHVERTLARHAGDRAERRDKFNENVSMRRSGLSEDPDAPPERAAAESAPPPDAKRVPLRLSRDAEVRDQSLVAVSFLDDSVGRSAPEPIFRVYAAFDGTSAADAWARVAGDEVTDVDIDICSTCAWLFCNNVRSEDVQKEVYRSKTLNDIIKERRVGPQRAENFRKWREESEPGEGDTPFQATREEEDGAAEADPPPQDEEVVQTEATVVPRKVTWGDEC